MRVLDGLLVVVKESALRRRAEYDVGTFSTHLINEYLQLILVVIPGTVARFLLFLVVMAKLHKDIVALLQCLQNLVQSSGSNERAGCQSTLGVIRYGHLGPKPTRNHLSPRGPRFSILVDNG